MVDQDLYILVTCDKCEVILGILPKYYQKATWKAGKARGAEDDEVKEVAAPGTSPKPPPGEAVIKALEKKKRSDDRRLRWS
jgi:hypothetical protein